MTDALDSKKASQYIGTVLIIIGIILAILYYFYSQVRLDGEGGSLLVYGGSLILIGF
jgi:hypothetical protein